MTTIQTFVPADYTVWALGGLVFVTAVADALYLCTLPCCRQPGSDRPTRPLSAGGGTRASSSLPILFYSRALMFVALAFWGASLILPLNVIWGPNSVVAGSNVTNWTSQGWLCRIFITLALGVTSPLVCVVGLCMLVFMLVRVKESQETLVSQQPVCCVAPHKSYIFERSGILSILVVLPIAAAQSLVAWISLSISYDGGSIEESPTSLIGTFLALFRYGSPEQCDVNVFTGVVTTNEYACTMCVFPAASVIIHGVWVIMLVLGLIYVTYMLCRVPILRQNVKRRIKAYSICMSLACVGGLCCMGVSIAYHDPFGWANQGLWLGYVATVLVSCISVTYMLDDIPKLVAQDINAQTVPMGMPPPPPPLYAPPSSSTVSSRMPSERVFNPMDQVVVPQHGIDDDDEIHSEAYFSTRESPSKRSVQTSDSFFSAASPSSRQYPSPSPSSRPSSRQNVTRPSP